MKKLEYEFFGRENVIDVAKELLGKVIVSNWDGLITSGRIVETEAYAGIGDRASHSYGGRRTTRTEIMFGDAAKAYVYLCYGIHHLFNIVTNQKDIPHVVLLRALEPIEGIDIMLKRTGKSKADYSLTKGPGNVSKALGLYTHHTGTSVLEKDLYIYDDGFIVNETDILATPRIGVDYAGVDAGLHYRFILKGNKYVSGKRVLNSW